VTAISDSILYGLLSKGPRSGSLSNAVTTGQVHVAGEVTTEAYATSHDRPGEILEIGYDRRRRVSTAIPVCDVAIGSQSPDIAQV